MQPLQRRFPLGYFMSDSAARTNYGPVQVDNNPVSANDSGAERGQRQSERGPTGLLAHVCLCHCLLTPVTK